MRRKLLFYLLGVMAIVGAGGAGGVVSLLAARHLGYLKGAEPDKPTAPVLGTAGEEDENPAEEETKVTASGRIRPKDGVINISGVPGDRLLKLEKVAKEGHPVKKGTLLAELESSYLRKAEHELAKTQLDEAKARKRAEEDYAAALLNEADLAKEQVELETHDRDAQEKKIDLLAAQEKSAKDDLDRLAAIRASDSDEIVSKQTYEHQSVLLEKAQDELAAARAQLTKLNGSISLGARQAQAKRETADASKARVPSIVQLDSLEKNVELAEKRLEMTQIKAPADGTILKVFLSQGETIAQQPILQMADTSEMIVVAEIPEEQAHSVKREYQASITAKALKAQGINELRGVVDYVGTIVARNPVAPSSPTAPVDKHVVETLIKLNEEDVKKAAGLIELEVLVTIHLPKAEATAAMASERR
jgi:HlyD family secretion protein